MAFTKIAAAGIGSTETVTLHSLEVINNATVGGVLTYEDVTNVDSIGLITARNGIVVGSGVTLSKDGDGFFTGIVTATTFSGAFSGDGSALTGVANTDVIFPDKISLGDGTTTSGDQINIGVGSDLKIVHNNSDGSQIISATTGLEIKDTGGFMRIRSDELKIQSTGNETYIEADANGSVQIFHDNSKKLETASGGVTVTGTVAATSYTGDGSALTGISAGIQTAVPKSVSGITTVLDLSNNDHKITVSGITTVDVRGGTEGDSHSLRIINSGITTVGFSTYFLFPSGGTPNLPTADGALSMISFTVHRQGVVGLATQLFAGASVNFS